MKVLSRRLDALEAVKGDPYDHLTDEELAANIAQLDAKLSAGIEALMDNLEQQGFAVPGWREAFDCNHDAFAHAVLDCADDPEAMAAAFRAYMEALPQ